ncbi:MAG: hypothetical protein E7223_02420 [Clostridiales bacterium]|nr:hypothetical protein [Clostridiales bacterium]
MDKKMNRDMLISKAKSAAKTLLNNAIDAVDQNDDGKFDRADMAVIAGAVGDAAKKGKKAIMDSAAEKTRQMELKVLQPIFTDLLDDAEFLMPKFIRVADRDKRHAESPVCQGSIGYGSDQKGMHLVNVFRDSLDSFGVTFYPDSDAEFYYMDPSERNRYIELDEYFSYLKIARINELQKIAQDLGAKYFKVTYKEEKASFSEKRVKVNANIGVGKKDGGKVDVDHHASEKKFSTVEIAAEMTFPGHAPVKPQLKYMQRDPSIQNLIAMRMDESAPLIHQKYMLQMSNSSGMKESDAVKIDAVLKDFKVAGNTTVASEARNEARRYLEYEIEF